jgi:hypothetical protein
VKVIKDAEQNLGPRLRWLLDRMWQAWMPIETECRRSPTRLNA